MEKTERNPILAHTINVWLQHDMALKHLMFRTREIGASVGVGEILPEEVAFS